MYRNRGAVIGDDSVKLIVTMLLNVNCLNIICYSSVRNIVNYMYTYLTYNYIIEAEKYCFNPNDTKALFLSRSGRERDDLELEENLCLLLL